jgi:adenosylmethionine-8-amino-7-oxononanoate aminotransferase
LLAHETVADVRGWGLFMVLELVEDKASRSYFGPNRKAEDIFQSIALRNGLALYSTLYGPRRAGVARRGLPMWISPPLTISEEEIDVLLDRLDRTIGEWERELGVGA